MKILVAVKRVVDPYVRVRIKSDNTDVDTQNIKMTMNPFDEIAVEEALRQREKNSASEVVVLSIGSDASQETLRHALALGADRALLVRTNDSYCSLNIAKIMQKIVADEKPDLILMGKQSIDGDNNQTPQMLAALLGWPQATFVSTLTITKEHIQVTREIDGGLETLKVLLPAVVSADLRLNEPRYASLPNIMKAKQKQLVIVELSSLSLTLKEHVQRLKVAAPVVREAGIKVNSVRELVDKLQYEAKLF